MQMSNSTNSLSFPVDAFCIPRAPPATKHSYVNLVKTDVKLLATAVGKLYVNETAMVNVDVVTDLNRAFKVVLFLRNDEHFPELEVCKEWPDVAARLLDLRGAGMELSTQIKRVFSECHNGFALR